MSRQGMVVVGVIVIGIAAVTAWATSARQRVVSAGFWFEDVTATTDGLARRLGSPITPLDLQAIESIARVELTIAFSNIRLMLSDSPAANYRVRVVADLTGGPRSLLPIAGVSRPLPGLRGDGAVNFSLVASNAIDYAPANASRHTIIEGIGRGVGRTAAHEFAHQILGSFPLHNTTDRLSYEYADLRSEHFYRDLHWSIASKELQDRLE